MAKEILVKDFNLIAEVPIVYMNRLAKVYHLIEEEGSEPRVKFPQIGKTLQHKNLKKLISNVLFDLEMRSPSEVVHILPSNLELDEDSMSLTRLTIESVKLAAIETLGYIFLADRIKISQKGAVAEGEQELQGITREHNTPEGKRVLSVASPKMQIAQISLTHSQDDEFNLVLTFMDKEELHQLEAAQSPIKEIPEAEEEEEVEEKDDKDDIIQRVLYLQEKDEEKRRQSAVNLAAHKAQAPYLTQSVKGLKPERGLPAKYLTQRDAPLEIPLEVVRSFFQVLDTNMDERINVDDIYAHIKQHQIPIEYEKVVEMFYEAARGRAIVHEHQKHAPLSLEEVAMAVRGRYKWNLKLKEWEVGYRPCRDYWIILLQTVCPRLFAMPIPKVIPEKIVAQFEEEEMREQGLTLEGTTGFLPEFSKLGQTSKSEGIMRRYHSVAPLKEPTFKRDKAKMEANVRPEEIGQMQYADKKKKKFEQNPYEQCINARINPDPKAPNNFVKISFDAKEFFNQAASYSEKIPYWKKDADNPIYHYVPSSEDPFKNYEETMASLTGETYTGPKLTIREHRLLELQHKDRSNLMLAGTMALRNAKKTPQEVMRQRAGFLTSFKLPTIAEQKQTAAQDGLNKKVKGQYQYVQNEYVPPSDHKFREDDPPFGKKDFTLRFKPDPPYNKHGVSEHDLRPKEVLDRAKKLEMREELAKKREYDEILNGKIAKRKDWLQYHTLPDKLTAISQKFPDSHVKVQKEKNAFLDKEEYTSQYLQLARTMKDDVVFGKPNLKLYFRSLKPADLSEEFGGTKTKPFKCIY